MHCITYAMLLAVVPGLWFSWMGGSAAMEGACGKDQIILKGHKDQVWAVAYSLDGKTLASADYDRTIKLRDAPTGKERTTLKGHTGTVVCLAISPDSATLASGSYDKKNPCKPWGSC